MSYNFLVMDGIIIKLVIIFSATFMLGSVCYYAYNLSEYLIAGLFFIMLLVIYIMTLWKLDLRPSALPQSLIRDENKLKAYYSKHKIIPLLNNSIMECRLIKIDENNFQIYCKDYPKNNLQGQLIKTKPLVPELVTTIWGYLQMNFDSLTDVHSVITQFDAYFVQEKEFSYPQIDYESQNEYCRMVLNPELSEIKCYQIWEKHPKYFYIKGNIETLNEILFNLQKDENAYLKYDDLFDIYRNFTNNEVLEEKGFNAERTIDI